MTKVTSSRDREDDRCIKYYPLNLPIYIGHKADDGSQLRPYIVWFGEYLRYMDEAMTLVKNADIFIVIGTSLVVYPAAGLVDEYFSKTIDYRRSRPYRRDRQNFLRLRKIPRYIIDPYDIDLSNLLDFEHIKTTAVEGVDILKEKIEAL